MPSSVKPPPGPPEGGVPAQVWLTTGDQIKLLSHESNVYLLPDSSVTVPILDVDAAQSYQQMLGFGAAFTDASAYLIQEKMSASQRDALLEDLFGRTSGIGLSFMRTTMGASDFSLRQYSYDDVPAGESDPTLAHFSIDADRADKLPLIKRALAINPQLTIVASPCVCLRNYRWCAGVVRKCAAARERGAELWRARAMHRSSLDSCQP